MKTESQTKYFSFFYSISKNNGNTILKRNMKIYEKARTEFFFRDILKDFNSIVLKSFPVVPHIHNYAIERK